MLLFDFGPVEDDALSISYCLMLLSKSKLEFLIPVSLLFEHKFDKFFISIK